MDFSLTGDQLLIRDAVREVCAQFPGRYWRDLEADGAYPAEFVATMTRLGWLSVLIPAEYGGGGQGVTEAGIILEEIHRSGGNANACHAQLYTMGALARHGSEEQKRRWLPPLAAGELRLQAFGITEPDAGSDSTKIATRAERDGEEYVVTGQKTFISRAEQTDLMLLLARTGPATVAIGDGLFFLDRASEYASRREVFGRPIGANQGVAFPLAQARARVEAASLLRFKASALFDAGQPCGAEANMAKLLASQASAEAGNAAMHAFGGNAFAAEYDIERKFRETKLLEIAPVSNNLVLAFLSQHVLGLPRSY